MLYNIYAASVNPSIVKFNVSASDGTSAILDFCQINGGQSQAGLIACAAKENEFLFVCPVRIAIDMLMLVARHGKKLESLRNRATTDMNFVGLVMDKDDAMIFHHYLPEGPQEIQWLAKLLEDSNVSSNQAMGECITCEKEYKLDVESNLD